MDPRDHKGDEGVIEGAEDGMTGEHGLPNPPTIVISAGFPSGWDFLWRV